MAKAIVRLDNVAATRNGALIKSAKLATDVENGNFVALGGLVTGEREIHTATVPTATTTSFGIVTTPELMYDEKKQLDEFVNVAGSVLRVTILTKGDIYSATAEAFDVVPTVGKFVELQAGTKGKVVATATASSTQVGKVIAVETVGTKVFYVVEVQ